jgi:glycosyltransferase involved in cell wall biosynthesis
MAAPFKLALLCSDAREALRDYSQPQPCFGTAPEALLQGFAALPEIEVHVVSCTQQPVAAAEKIAPNIWFHSLLVPKLGWLRTGYQGCVRAVRRRLRQLRPDLVHGQGTERDCALSAVFSGFPNLVTIHGNMAELARLFRARPGSFHWWTARLEGFTLRRAGGVFCNSEYTERLVRPRARRTWRVPNAMRPAFFAPSKLASVPGRCVLINVGVIGPRKRQVELLDLARQLHQQGAAVEFQFVGIPDQSEYAGTFATRMREAESQGYARYLGTMSTPELIDWFDQASAMVHFPSEESFGLVVAEALARGLKLFGARAGGIVEIASAAPDAELFDVEDWSGLREAITRWIAAGFPRPRQGADAMRARYHPQVVARQHLAIYREFLSTAS